MKNIIILLTMLGASFFAFSQEPSVQWGTPFTDETPQAGMVNILKADNTGFYLLRDNKSLTNHLAFLEKYSYDFKLLYSLQLVSFLSQGQMGNSMLYRTILTGKDKFYAFSQGWNKDAGKGSYTVKTISTDGVADDNAVELESVPALKQMNAGYHYPCLSPDKSKLLILTEMPFEKGSNENIRLRVFDAINLKELWNKDITLNFESKRGVNNEGFIDNNGNVFLFKKFEQKEGTKYLIYTCDAAGKEWKENLLDLKGKDITQSSFLVNSNGNVIFTGFFYSKFDSSWEGMFYYLFNNSLTLSVQKCDPFDSQFLSGLISEGQASKEGATIKNFMVRDRIPVTGNGNLYIIIEQEIMNQKSLPPVAGQASLEYEYTILSNEIVVMCVKNDGSMEWSAVVPKHQNTVTRDLKDRWDSFVYGVLNNKVYILWNNIDLTPRGIEVNPPKWTEPDGRVCTYKNTFDPDYWDKKGPDIPRTTNHGTFLYIVEPDGRISYSDYSYGMPLRNLHKGGSVTMSLRPDIFYTLEDGLILMGQMSSQSKMMKFGKMKL
ncbi:MAG: hypothetical protein ABIJ16_12560 [Bacteroidota bacterium]